MGDIAVSYTTDVKELPLQYEPPPFRHPFLCHVTDLCA